MPAGVLGGLVGVRDALQLSVPVFWFALAGLVGCTLWTLVGPRLTRYRVPALRLAAVLAVGFALIWVVVDKRLEGRTLVILSDRHGITVSDLASVAAVLIAGWRLLTLRLSSARRLSRVPERRRPVGTGTGPGE